MDEGVRGRSVMRLSSSLLILIFCVSQSCMTALQCSTSSLNKKVPEFTVCATSNQTKQLNEIECKYPYWPPFERCHDDTSPSAPCWMAGDNGTVDVAFPLLPQECEYTSYEAVLMIYETVHHNCSALKFNLREKTSPDLLVHSKKGACVVNCSEPNCMNRCTQRGKLTFQHVFSGCYQLIVTPSLSLQPCTSCQLRSRPTYLSTGHEKTPIPSQISLVPEGKNDSLSLKATFSMNPTSSRFHLMQDIDKSLGPEGCQKSGTCIAFCDTYMGSRRIKCESSDGKSNVSCHYQSENVVSCEFSHLNAGNYCVRLTLYDDRCQRDTVWDNNDYTFSMCAWQTEIIEISPVKYTPESIPPGSKDSVMLAVLIFFILGCVGLAWWKLHHRINYNKPGFTPILPLISQVPERPRVLLLYARDCPAFLEAIVHFKRVLKRACDSEVMDCWEDSQYQIVAQGPSCWVRSLLSDCKVRTVLVTSPASIRLESCMINGSRVCYQQPRAFDCVLTQALNILHETYAPETYKSLFIVRLCSRKEFGEELESNRSRACLNPLTTYELPVHLNALLANLQNMNTKECGILENMESDVDCLNNAIFQYRRYLSEHPDYLDSILVTDNG